MNQKKKGDEQFVDWSRRGTLYYYVLIAPAMISMMCGMIAFALSSWIPALCLGGAALSILISVVIKSAAQFNLQPNPAEIRATTSSEELSTHAQYALGADGELIELTKDDAHHLS